MHTSTVAVFASLLISSVLLHTVQCRATSSGSALPVEKSSGGQRSLEDLQTVIEEFVQDIMVTKDIPGLSLSIVSGNEKLIKGFGVQSLEPGSPAVDENTLFYIASTTKAMTACLLTETLRRYNLSLTTPIKQLLPEFQVAEFYRQEQATAEDLLAHRMGVPESLYNWLLGAVTTSRLDIVQRGLYFNPSLPFRGSSYYSNLFYIAAGLVVERLTGLSWEEAIQQTLFRPLGMSQTSTMPELTEEQLSRLVTANEPDWRNGNVMREVSQEFFKHAVFGGPSGDVVSNANDLAHWLYMLTHRGLNEAGERVVDEQVIDQIMTPRNVFWLQGGQEPFVRATENYGLGWYTGFYRGYRIMNHAGYMFGYHSLATIIPALNLGIFTCINGQNNNGESGMTTIHDFITDLILGETPASVPPPSGKVQQNVRSGEGLVYNRQSTEHPRHLPLKSVGDYQQLEEAYASAVRKAVVRADKKDEFLDQFVGLYGNFAYGNVTIVFNEATGRLQGHYGDLATLDMVHLGADWFVGRAADPLWFFPPMEMQFGRRSTDNVVFNVTVPILLEIDPPVFVRGLTQDQAPRPPTCDC